VLESRAILEIIQGRLEIIDKFHSMIVNNAPETPHRKGDDNMHDLIAEYPWLLNPEWQVLAEEKTISKQLQQCSCGCDPVAAVLEPAADV
jgi:RecB family endonuclease NucS